MGNGRSNEISERRDDVEHLCPSCYENPQCLNHQDDSGSTGSGKGWRKYHHFLLLLVGSVLTLILITGMILIMRKGNNNDNHDETEGKKPIGKCETEGCHKASKGMKTSMNLMVDPCEDFYEYVCGSYPVDQGDNSTSTFSLMQKQNLQLIQEYLDEPSLFQPLTGKGVELAHNFYQSCIHQNNTGNGMLSNIDDVGISIDYDDDNFHHHHSPFPQDNLNSSSLLLELNTTTEQGESRTVHCTKLTQAFFPDVTSRIFLSMMSYDSEKQRGILKIMDEVYDTYKSLIGRISWLNPFSKDYVISRNLEGTKHVAGYPDELFKNLEEREEQRYGSLEISREGSDYFWNLFNLNLLRNISEILNPSEEDVLISQVPNSNAFYLLQARLIFVPAGISQDPFYTQGYPDILNYAKLGSILGHEFTHAFQDNFDLDNGFSLLSYQDERNMRERVGCVKDQYEGFHQLDDDHLNSVTWKEDLADILGFQVGFKLTQKIWEGERYRVLPGLEMFTPQQIFFIAAAQTECRSFKNAEIKREVLRKQIVEDEHSPPSIRIRGGMSNNDEFAKAFNCPRGSKYNPVKKCRFFD